MTNQRTFSYEELDAFTAQLRKNPNTAMDGELLSGAPVKVLYLEDRAKAGFLDPYLVLFPNGGYVRYDGNGRPHGTTSDIGRLAGAARERIFALVDPENPDDIYSWTEHYRTEEDAKVQSNRNWTYTQVKEITGWVLKPAVGSGTARFQIAEAA